MEILHLLNGRPPQRLEALQRLPDAGLVWADFVRSQAQGWECWAEPLIGAAIEPQHVTDSHNADHPSFFDGTPAYDMLIFEGLGPKDGSFPLETRTAAFFLFDRMLLTVRAEDNISFDIVKQKLIEGRLKTPANTLLLTHLVLDTMVDRYLRIREPMDRRFTQLQDELLDQNVPVENWRALLMGRREARRLEALSESQLEALDAWRRGSRLDWSGSEEVRIRNLSEHITRVLTHASDQERDIEAAVQLHFASVSHRTNKIVQALTVLSAIFFPLTLITGIYGMNFDNMPELHWQHGYFMVLGLLATVGGVLFYIFKRRGFF